MTHLYVAVYNNHLEVSKLLIEKGANVNAKDNEGETSFDLFIKYQKEEVADYLKSVGEKNKMFVSYKKGKNKSMRSFSFLNISKEFI